MDIYALLAVIVALITCLSAYLLFNDPPAFPGSGSRRQTRRR